MFKRGVERTRLTDGNGDSLGNREHDELSSDGETIDERLHDLSVRCSCENDLRTSQLLQFGSLIDDRSIEVVVRSQLRREVLLAGSRGESDGPVAHAARELDREVTQSSDSLDGHNVSGNCVHVAQAVEDRDTSTDEGSCLGGIHVGGDGDDGLSTESNVLSVTTVAGDSIDGLRGASDKVSAVAESISVVWGVAGETWS